MSWLQESFDRKAEPLWEAFNLTGLQLSRLADRRRRTPKGQFADEISQLSVAGDSKTIGNVTVTRVSDGAGIPEFKVEARLKGQSGSTEFVLGAGTAAARAEDASAADTHPDSLGGTTSYPNADYVKGGRRQAFDHEDLEKKGAEILGPGPWDKGVQKRVQDLIRGGIRILGTPGTQDTQRSHKPGGRINEKGEYEGGKYTEERQVLHRAILSRFLQGIDEERTNREILFMGGGAAAGKSTMLRTGVTAKPDGSVLINPDAIKGMIPEYNELIRLKDPGAAAAVHEESSDIGKMLMAMATGRGMNVTVDKVKIKEQEINHAQNLGYKARGAVATISINEAKKRAKKRGEDTGRFVGDQTLTDGHREVVRGFPE